MPSLLEQLGRLTAEELEQLVAETLAIRSLADFVRQAWPALNSRPLIWGWHLDAVCEHLEALTSGEIRKLAVAVPPGTAKSMLCSVIWPAWEWLQRPDRTYLAVASTSRLAIRDAKRCRDLCGSAVYQRLQAHASTTSGSGVPLFGPLWSFDKDQDAKAYFQNTALGARLSQSVGSAVTGHRAGTIIVDDPLDTRDAYPGSARLREVNEYYAETLSTREEDEATTRWMVVQQRQEANDLIGHLQREEPEDWVFLTLPAEFDPGRRCTTSIGWSDPRKEAGELLTSLFTAEGLKRRRRKLGWRYAAQYNQDPRSGSGGIFSPDWVHRYAFADLPQLDWIAISCDATLRETKDSDRVSIQVWGGAGARRYLLWRVCRRMGLVETKSQCKLACSLYPTADAVLIERAHNGAAVIEELHRHVSGVMGVDQLGERNSKIARAHAVSPQWEAGDCFLPLASEHHPLTGEECWWADEVRDEILEFPMASHDDDVDAMGQVLIWARERACGFWFGVG